MKRIVAGNSISAPQAGRTAGRSERRRSARSNGRRSLKPAAPGALGLALLAGSLLLAGCGPTGDLFSEYRGTNLIPEAGFDSDVWELVAFEDGSTPLSDADLATYALVEAVTDGSASADTTDLPNGTTSAEIRRLELKNLFPNGDFDTADASAWVPFSGATTSIVSSGPNTIDGNGLRYDIGVADAYVLYRLNTDTGGGLLDANGSTLPGASYLLDFDFLTQTQSLFTHHDSTIPEYKSWLLDTGTITGAPALYDFQTLEVIPELAIEEAATEYFGINVPFEPSEGALTIQRGTLDNVRVARSDLRVGYRAIVPVAANAFGSLSFLNGPYRFSVHVRVDPTHTNDADTADEVANRFAAENVTLRMESYRLDESASQPLTSAQETRAAVTGDPGSGEGSWESWTRVSVEGQLQVADADYSDQELAIVLTVEPTDTLSAFGATPGSVLIARPHLEFLADPEAVE